MKRYLLPLAGALALPPTVHANLIQATIGGPSPSIAKVNENFNSSTSANDPSLVTNLTSAAASDLFVIMVKAYNDAIGGTITATTVTADHSISCSHATGTPGPFASIGAGLLNPISDIWYCQNTAGSGVSINFTFTVTSSTGNTMNTPSMLVAEFTGAKTSGVDAAVGNAFTSASAGTTVNIATSAALSQTNSLTVSAYTPTVSDATTLGGSQLTFATPPAHSFSYQVTAPASTITHTYSGFAGSQNLSASIAGFLHP